MGDLPDRFKDVDTSNAGLEDFLAKDAAIQKKMAEKLRKNPIDPKKYKGKIQKIDFSEEPAPLPKEK
jgi:hypothetical protein